MTSRPRRIVLIGRDGQVSRALNLAFQAAGDHVVTLARPGFDLADPASSRRAVAEACPDLVINPAAYTAVDRAEDEPALAAAINILGAEAVALGAADAGAPIIHFSTDYVFDGAKTEPYVESDKIGPLGVYGQTKLEGEGRVAAANPCHIILRTAWVCSPHGNNFVKTMLRLSADRAALQVVDDQYGSPTFAGDLADVVAKIVPAVLGPERQNKNFGVFHAANAGRTTWCRFARAIIAGSAQRGGRDVPVHAITTSEYPTRARRPANSLLSTSKLQSVHGISMRPWEAALADCLDDLIGRIKDTSAA